MMRIAIGLAFFVGSALQAADSGDAQIRAKAGPSEIVITTTSRLAGAIHSLTWNGREFIDSADHGRQLQSASNFDAGSRIQSETYNPTEAGSRFDGAGPRSTSVLHALHARGNKLTAVSQMAFWLRPGDRSGTNLAKNTSVLSNHWLKKRVTIGVPGLPHAIQYDTTFTVPEGEVHRHAVFEAVTGYMPAAFSKFWMFDPVRQQLQPLSDGPGELAKPVILATPGGLHAMGVWSAGQPSKGFEQVGYGRFRFAPQKVVKWNCVFRVNHPKAIRTGNYTFRCYVLVGSLKNVTDTMAALHRRSAQTSPR
jgi:hypothetical protein